MNSKGDNMKTDIAYKEYKKKSDIHGTILYPAVMVAPMQKEILGKLINKAEINSVFDAFHGSGTSLYETLEISDKIRLVGCDINPLANLITKVKLEGVNNNITKDIEKLKMYIESYDEYEKFDFNNIKKWFREDIIDSLSKLRDAIIKIENKQNRLYFWCMLCDIIRKYSNTRSSTYKLHTKKIEVINKMENNVVRDYINSVEKNMYKFNKHTSNFELFKCDTLKKIKEFKENEFDISITSPPYGDNATTVPYGQFSILDLKWIASEDLELEGWELENYAIIDTKSLGSCKIGINISEYALKLLNPYLQKISESKKVKVEKFFNDYFVFLDELCRVTNNYIVMTLGNRTVDGININLTDITMKYLESKKFINLEFMEREILSKRTPKMTSRVNNKSVSSMNHEYVIIHQKKKY
jgi:site-specific DNA-methyltransferase (cytosine-N4-specific)